MTKHCLNIKARNTDLDKKLDRFFDKLKITVDMMSKKDSDFYNVIKKCQIGSEMRILQFDTIMNDTELKYILKTKNCELFMN